MFLGIMGYHRVQKFLGVQLFGTQEQSAMELTSMEKKLFTTLFTVEINNTLNRPMAHPISTRRQPVLNGQRLVFSHRISLYCSNKICKNLPRAGLCARSRILSFSLSLLTSLVWKSTNSPIHSSEVLSVKNWSACGSQSADLSFCTPYREDTHTSLIDIFHVPPWPPGSSLAECENNFSRYQNPMIFCRRLL